MERYKEVLQLAVPLVFAGLAVRISTIIHAALVARISQEAVAAVIVGGLTFILATILPSAVGIGVQALVARKVGAEEPEEIGPVLTTGASLGMLLGLISTGLLYLLAPLLFQQFDKSAAISATAEAYLNVRLLSIPAYVLVQILAACLMGMNSPWRALSIIIGGQILDAAVAAYLVLGEPNMGIMGAAWGSIAGELATLALLAAQWPAFAQENGITLQRPTDAALTGIWKVAAPIAVRRAMRPFQILGLFWIFGQMGRPVDMIVGALTVKLSLLAQSPGGGFGKASAILAAHDLGSEKRRRARKRPIDAVKVALVIMGIVTATGLLFPRPVLEVFLKNPAFLEEAVGPFRLVCAAIPFATVTGVFATTLLAIGSARAVAVNAFLLRFVVALPLSYLLGVTAGFGVLGVVAVDAGMSIIRMVLSIQAISRPRWTRIESNDMDPVQIDDGM